MEPGEMVREQSPVEAYARNARPVFILGIAERSGTTYLQDILRLHPDCDVDGVELEEHHFVTYADMLVEYVEAASRRWKSPRGAEQVEQDRELVYRCLGDGLISYMREDLRNRRGWAGLSPDDKPRRALVTKTPCVANLDLFFKLFPDAYLLILIRDGRAVVESAVRTFYKNFVQEARQWAQRAQCIIQFASSEMSRGRRYMIVRYEDLYRNTDDEVKKILSFLDLEISRYDFNAAHNVPVKGSCTLRSEGAEWPESFVAPGIHWAPVPKPPDFSPIDRWSTWGRAKHERFNWIAGKYLQLFGYEMKCFPGRRWPWVLWNRLLDILPLNRLVHLWRKAVREMRFSHNKAEAVLGLCLRAFRQLTTAHVRTCQR
jgi:hypothetical protein